jgi:hypothetical protein
MLSIHSILINDVVIFIEGRKSCVRRLELTDDLMCSPLVLLLVLLDGPILEFASLATQ